MARSLSSIATIPAQARGVADLLWSTGDLFRGFHPGRKPPMIYLNSGFDSGRWGCQRVVGLRIFRSDIFAAYFAICSRCNCQKHGLGGGVVGCQA